MRTYSRILVPLIMLSAAAFACGDEVPAATLAPFSSAPTVAAAAATPAERSAPITGEPGTAQILEPGWATPIKLPFNDDGWEDSPYITRDGSEIHFFYHPYPDLISTAEGLTEVILNDPAAAVAAGLDGKTYISARPFVEKTIHPISQNDSPGFECCTYISDAGDIFYNSNRFVYATGEDSPATMYLNADRIILGTGDQEANPHYCDARDELWFDCPGDANICVMENAAASNWGGEVELAPYPVNAEDWENVQDAQPYLTDDCNTMYFTSDRDNFGSIQIFRTNRLEGEGQQWSEPELFIRHDAPVAELSMTADGNELIFAQIFWREDGTPGIDIYYSSR